MVKKIMPDAPVDSLRVLFDPAVAGKLKACGINYVDSPEDVVQLALLYNGKSPNTQDPADIKAAYETLSKVRDTVRTVDSTNYLNALAAGDICISIGWVGNDIQAAKQAHDAGKNLKLHFVIPKEGMPEYIDNMVIMKDAPHPKNAQLFLNYIMEAEVTADIINSLGYPMPNLAARPMIKPEILNNNTIYPDAEALAGADLSELEDIVRSTGFYANKSRSLVGMAQALVERFDGEVPTRLEDLVTLPGVGRKTGNVVRSVAFDLPGLPVDTHVGRLSRRLGLTTEQDPVKVERQLNSYLPPGERGRFSLRMILHGRRVCDARRPRCEVCVLADICPSSRVPTVKPVRSTG
jgi:endonuclease III